MKWLIEEFGMNDRKSSIDMVMYNGLLCEMTNLQNESLGDEAIRWLTKYFNLSRKEFKERVDSDYYYEEIIYIKGGKRLTKDEKYQKWLNKIDCDEIDNK